MTNVFFCSIVTLKEVIIMVTDAQHKELLGKVQELERKINMLSLQLNRLVLKGDLAVTSSFSREEKTRRDTTKYKFGNQIYCKRRLVLACVKRYIEENNIDDFDVLLNVFPDGIQGSLGVIKPAEIAQRYANAHRRFYFEDQDIVYLSGLPYVVCSQWEKRNIERFLRVAEDLGYNIQQIWFE